MNTNNEPSYDLFRSPLDPCRHMKVLLSRLSDDDLKGVSKWYAEFHASGCPKCRTALEALQQLPARVRIMAEQEDIANIPAPLTDERWAAIERAMSEAAS